MNKKIIGIIVLMLIMASFFTNIIAAKDSLVYTNEGALTSNVPEKYLEYNPDNVTEVKTVGPSSFFIYATDIILIDGPFLKVSLIEMILGSRNFHFIFSAMLFSTLLRHGLNCKP